MMFDAIPMRTTLDLDPDVLEAAKQLAAQRGTTAGKVISELARRGLAPEEPRGGRSRHGVPVLPARRDAKAVTLETVNRLRDELP
jgi:hypothetical protein